jgi:signal transduction histidine kinase
VDAAGVTGAYRQGMADRRRGPWLEIGLTVALLVVGVFGTAGAYRNQHQTPTTLAFVLVVLAALPVLVQHYRPLWTLALTGGLTLLYLGLGYAYGPILVTLAVVVLAAALRLAVRTSLVALGGLLVGAGLAIGVDVLAGTRGPAELIFLAAWLMIPGAAGIAIRARRDAAAEVRAARSRRAVSEERLRLAQEVHDVAGHGFSVIAMQAGIALRVFERDPAGAKTALEHIRAASREALDGLRAEIEALRQDVPLRPTTGLADLPALADRLRATGLPIDLSPSVEKVPPDVDQAAYRIVQESLTNVLRHAGADATATIQIGRTDDALRIDVTDTGRGVVALRESRGIDGMRTRAESLGGTLEAGPGPTGGFAVRSVIPLDRPR